MGVRSRLANLAKVFGNSTPAEFTAGETAAQMTPASPFSPGTPIRPYDGYSRTPRGHEFVPGYNISARPRAHERVTFETLRSLIESYDVAQMCIWHRIDSIRSLDWSLVAAAHFEGDVTDAVRLGMAALRKPDRQTPFSTWLSAYLYDVLAYDAGALYRLRNRRGDVVGLMNVDGTTVAPLLDYWGRSPEPPAEAYVQYINGLPWDWLTRDDLIYEPFRKRANSPYGLAPLETILLNANTDIRFQMYFLQRFTEGNVPEAFASAPESWSPDQIEQWQTLWDSFMAGDQAAKHTIKWMPGGSTIAWSNEKDFTDQFSLFLMRKTAAAFHVVPSDLGFTENVNLSSGESQADVQHRVGDLPLIRHLQNTISAFLQDDLGLPLDFLFDLGEEQADRLQQAQADQIYVQLGAISSSDIRSMRYGLEEPEGIPVPRFIYDPRGGPIPLASLYAVAGQIDPSTAAPKPGTELPHTAFGGAEGVVPNPPILTAPLAEQEFGPSALPPAPPPQPTPPDPGAPVAKDGGATTVGITTATGVTGYDLIGRRDDEDEPEDQEKLSKSELTAYRSFRKARQRAGKWRDFEFRVIDPARARRLNQAGRLAVRKAEGQVAVAGLAVQAADTGRVLMLQRALDPEDPAGGTWEMPGGHLEGDETPLLGAWREWAEETGSIPPPGQQTGTWISPDGAYQGIVWTVDGEDSVPLDSRDQVSNPDDPDGDCVEAIAWWDPAQLAGNPAVRTELLASLPDVLTALGCETADTVDDIAKAAASPKGQAPDGADTQSAQRAWPGWNLDLQTVAHWVPLLAAGLVAAVSARELAKAWLALAPAASASTKGERLNQLTTQADDFLQGRGTGTALREPIGATLRGVTIDGYAIGAASAHAAADAHEASAQPGSTTADMGTWTPGASDVARDLVDSLGDGNGLAHMLDQSGSSVQSIATGRLNGLAHALANGVEAGDDLDAISEAITDVLSDPSRAEMAVATELARTANTAAVQAYRQRDIERVRWATADDDRVCPVCDANEAAGPRTLGDDFPSGDPMPPAHPRDRCALLPT
ncbi:phage portal protein [Kitasatospora kifunensis]|uniref:SPP1 gp7 family putative phage head morphogenesis protein n=1 Tax=Kitasatospora kifunensis TaxID=58351 RepID=A0A7W7QZ97_KITKI|nr:phage portal protein [Kitasatospora kifunensis]MBB4922264.1 SPP1 gp7 family putative phage head morphogenesis protein [Kitasatospora kifunensis]